MRHGLAALVLAALLLPLMPVSAPAMACCKGGGDACACPLELGFARCQPGSDLAAPHAGPAFLPPPPPAIALAERFEALPAPSNARVSFAPLPSVPPPRA